MFLVDLDCCGVQTIILLFQLLFLSSFIMFCLLELVLEAKERTAEGEDEMMLWELLWEFGFAIEFIFVDVFWDESHCNHFLCGS